MANTTPDHHDTLGAAPVGNGYLAGPSVFFGDPNLALFGGFGPSTAGTPSANDGM
jgi:hypothetical protein